MKKTDPFTDQILGQWKFNKKKSNTNHWCFSREAVIKLAKIHAQDYFDPETHEQQIIYGEVKLVHHKLIDRNNSDMALFRYVEKTPNSVTEKVIV